MIVKISFCEDLLVGFKVVAQFFFYFFKHLCWLSFKHHLDEVTVVAVFYSPCSVQLHICALWDAFKVVNSELPVVGLVLLKQRLGNSKTSLFEMQDPLDVLVESSVEGDDVKVKLEIHINVFVLLSNEISVDLISFVKNHFCHVVVFVREQCRLSRDRQLLELSRLVT